MLLRTLLRHPLALLGALAIGTAAAFSSFSIVRAEQHQPPPKSCSKSGVCVTIKNTGPAEELESTSTNTRAFYVYSDASGSDGTDINGGYIGIIGRAPSGDYPLVLTDNYGNDLDYTDGKGDFYYLGSLVQFAKTRGGQTVASYGCQSTTQTLEDVGTARLENGRAFVRLHRTFGEAIELQNDPYRVFLTPNGDSRGLYVSQKTTNGFEVRESERGRSTLDFDYRVVATALGHAGERMGVTQLAPMPQAPAMR